MLNELNDERPFRGVRMISSLKTLRLDQPKGVEAEQPAIEQPD